MTPDAIESTATLALNALPTVDELASEERRRVVSDRLEELKEVKDGWHEGEGIALDPEGLDWLGHQMCGHYVKTDLLLPGLFPNAQGGVIAEWSMPRVECGLEIDLKAHTGSWFDVDIETEEGIEERVLDLDSETDWRWMTERLASLVDSA